MRPSLCSVLLLALCLPLAADTRSELFRLLDNADGEDRAALLAALEALPLSPAEGVALLREGRRYGAAETGHFTRTLTSAEGVESEVQFWVPEDYDPTVATPVVIFLHGLGASPRMFYNLIGHGCAARGWILIMPQAERLKDVTHLPIMLRGANLMQHWWSYHAEDNFGLVALDWLARHYNVDHDRVALGGYSMGGYATWNLGVRYHDRFSALIPYAAGDVSATPGRHTRDDAYRQLENLALTESWITHSKDDQMVSYRIAERIMAALDELGIAYHSDIVDGEGHRLRVGGEENERTLAMFAWLDEQRRNPTPERFSHVALDEHNAWAYNVELRSWEGRLGEVELRRDGRSIALEAPGGTALAVYLEPDDGRPLTVGGEVCEGSEERGWEVVVDSWLARRDPAFTWCRRVLVEVEEETADF